MCMLTTALCYLCKTCIALYCNHCVPAHTHQASSLQEATGNAQIIAQVLEDLSTYPSVGRAIADENSQEATDEAQLDQHVSRPADIICALNFSVFLLDSR